jgi:hypothetical protein
VLAANTPKFTGNVPADADELLEQLVVFGPPVEARRRLARWHVAGAAMPALLLRPNQTLEEIAYTLEAFGPMLSARRDRPDSSSAPGVVRGSYSSRFTAPGSCPS